MHITPLFAQQRVASSVRSMPADESLIRLDHLTKQYGSVTALNDLTFSLPPRACRARWR